MSLTFFLHFGDFRQMDPTSLYPLFLTRVENHSLYYLHCLLETWVPASPTVCSSFLFGEKTDDERRSRVISHTAPLCWALSTMVCLSAAFATSAEPLTDRLRREGEKKRAIKTGNVIHKISFLCGCCFIGYFNPFKINLRTIQNNKGMWLNFWL